MKDIRYYLGWLLVILPLHGIEQFMFGLDELYELRSSGSRDWWNRTT